MELTERPWLSLACWNKSRMILCRGQNTKVFVQHSSPPQAPPPHFSLSPTQLERRSELDTQ